MQWFFIAVTIGVILLVPTAYAGFIGAPYAPTRLPVVRKALKSLGVKEGDVFYDLGAGDGSIVREAARTGSRAIGYELSPIMWAIAWLRTRSVPQATIRFGNFYKKDLSDATVLFAFLMPKTLPHLVTWLSKQSFPKGKYLLTYVFPADELTPITMIREQKCGPIYVYDLREVTEAAPDLAKQK